MTLPQSNGKTVLVFGINGYIAFSINLELLKEGYTLRETARTIKSMEALLQGAYKEYADRCKMIVVPDMTVPGAFNEAVKDDFVTPAVNGFISILTSALNHAGSQLKSFVLTSFTASVGDLVKPAPNTFTNADWNNWAETKAQELGDSAPIKVLYSASKVAAERAVWKFRNEHKPPFFITAVHPGVITRPSVQLASSFKNLNVTLAPIWAIFFGATTEIPPGIGPFCYINVCDVAAIHIWCIEHPSEAANQRYIGANERGPPQATADILRKAYPDHKMIPVGKPESDYLKGYGYGEDKMSFDSSKMVKALGRPMIGFEKSILDTAKVFERYL